MPVIDGEVPVFFNAMNYLDYCYTPPLCEVTQTQFTHIYIILDDSKTAKSQFNSVSGYLELLMGDSQEAFTISFYYNGKSYQKTIDAYPVDSDEHKLYRKGSDRGK